jgi:mannitol 2-dehydrogenase
MIRLNDASIASVRTGVATPKYDRSKVTTGIVHLGVGGFHRSHMAMALDDLMNQGEALDWGICGVGLMEFDRKMKDALQGQDCLYTLTLKHSDGRREPRIVGSINEYLFAPDDVETVLERLSQPSTKIVSLTITEGGYNFDRVTGEFDPESPAVAADLLPGSVPATAFGLVIEGLRRRRDRGIPPFTVLSCDNIQGNGDIAKKMFLAFAQLKDAVLANWIDENVAFPNSMVDRITPVTSAEDITEAAATIGLEDAWPVVAEPFFQWVIEDQFTLGRPNFDEVGAQFVGDVEPYELMKLRLLNASHQGLTYFGYLSGYRFAHEAVGDPAIAGFLMKYMDNEATPTLKPVPGIDLAAYKHMLIERFSNPEVRDTLARLCAESSDRIPKWLVPVIREQLATGGDVTRSAAIVASWARYAEGVDEDGNDIVVVDPLKDHLVPIAKSQRKDPLAFIKNESLFGDLAKNKTFSEKYLSALKSLFENGAHQTVQSLA